MMNSSFKLQTKGDPNETTQTLWNMRRKEHT